MLEKISPEIRQNLRFLILLSALLASLFMASYLSKSSTVPKEPQPILVDETVFDSVSLTAKAAYVYDVRAGGAIFSKNENMRLPLASLTKVMAALVATEIAPPGAVITIPAEALKAEGDNGLKAGEQWLLEGLLDFSLVASSNDGIMAVALSLGARERSDADPEERVTDFVAEMNKKADELGMLNTYFWNPTGLDETERKGGAYGTVRDMTVLLEYVLRERPNLLEATTYGEVTLTSLDHNLHVAKNTSLIAASLPGLKGSKTGFTNVAGGNLVIAFDPEVGRPVIVAVLGSTAEDRFEDVLKLVDATTKYLNGKQLSIAK